ncbi:hypothetical protein [Erwinia sp. JH02]|nr:hypothetical protein [Erwinia sp. JH02]NNS06226.1 hypothetical protein [Erwinia sp. JH02]
MFDLIVTMAVLIIGTWLVFSGAIVVVGFVWCGIVLAVLISHIFSNEKNE